MIALPVGLYQDCSVTVFAQNLPHEFGKKLKTQKLRKLEKKKEKYQR